MLVAHNIHQEFSADDGITQVLRGVDLEISAKESLAITGDSGSGKSTILHVLAGLQLPTEGSVKLLGNELTLLPEGKVSTLRCRHIGLIFQQFNLISSLTVDQNIAFQARLNSRFDPAWHDELLTKLGLSAQKSKYPETLSGGQQQRVSIGRALAGRPDIILADEPTGNLDEENSEIILNLMLDLIHETGAALVMATHSTTMAAKLQRRVHLSFGKLIAKDLR